MIVDHFFIHHLFTFYSRVWVTKMYSNLNFAPLRKWTDVDPMNTKAEIALGSGGGGVRHWMLTHYWLENKSDQMRHRCFALIRQWIIASSISELHGDRYHGWSAGPGVTLRDTWPVANHDTQLSYRYPKQTSTQQTHSLWAPPIYFTQIALNSSTRFILKDIIAVTNQRPGKTYP